MSEKIVEAVESLRDTALSLMSGQHFSMLAIGGVDLVDGTFHHFQIVDKNFYQGNEVLFDLASLTKALTLGVWSFSHLNEIDNDLSLLLEHRAGLPSGGILFKNHWKEQIASYSVRKSETLYSDYSAIKAQLEIEKRSSQRLYEMCSPYWDSEIFHWKKINEDIKNKFLIAPTGFRNNKTICGEVHDPNAFNLKVELAHAGLFGTVSALCRTLIKLEKELNLSSKVVQALNDKPKERFVWGFDTVTDFEKTLAGVGASRNTFGHLGFTGTSFWIDPKRLKGLIILSNATQNYWFERDGLNQIRRQLGSLFWSSL